MSIAFARLLPSAARSGLTATIVLAGAMTLLAAPSTAREKAVEKARPAKHLSQSSSSKHRAKTRIHPLKPNHKGHAGDKAKSHGKSEAKPSSPSHHATTDPRFLWQPAAGPRQASYLIPAGQDQPAYPAKSATFTPAQHQQKAGRTVHVGKASYYSDAFEGKRTASGERFDQDKLTCAHGNLPFGCKLRVTNLRNNKSVDVTVNDRGSFHKQDRVLDLSRAAAREIGMVSTGTAKVKVELLP
jgi:rare lipoprotein A